MCGIFGVFDKLGVNEDRVRLATNSMFSRGPDGSGIQIFKNKVCAFGHRRLSIIDLTENGAQPMQFASLNMTFNGEIYNYKELKSLLLRKGYSFTSNTDSEVFLKLYHCFGNAAFERCIGMWAVAIYDEDTRDLVLCRDRLGVKPLCFMSINDKIIFASETTAIKKYLNVSLELETKEIKRFLELGYVSHNNCIFKKVKKVSPGAFICFKNGEITDQIQYWRPQLAADDTKIIDQKECIKELQQMLEDSCNYRMVSDAPIGVFLSGGMDSSVVTALTSKSFDVETFTIGFDGSGHYDETSRANLIAKTLGTKHNHKNFSAEDLDLHLVSALTAYDEPFGDSSAVPTFLLSKFASSKVKVALSADGGDEIFGGYNWYRSNASSKMLLLLQILKKLSIDQSLARLICNIESQNFHSLPAPTTMNIRNKVLRILNIIENENENKFNYGIKSLMYHDIKDYLPNDILVKTDRASMANSLEVREPLLDHRLIELAFKLQNNTILRNKNPKHYLQEILKTHLPNISYTGPKQGFSIPLKDDRYRQVLQKHVDDYLSKSQLDKYSIVDSQKCQNLIASWRKNGKNNDRVWWLLALHVWLEHNHN